MGTWYKTGYEAAEEEEKRQEERKQELPSPDRFFMLVGKSIDVVFVDDNPFSVNEHQFKDFNGSLRNWMTCMTSMDPNKNDCCLDLGYYSFISYRTVVDCGAWTDKNGKKHQYELKLYPAKVGTTKRLAVKKREFGTLDMRMFTVTRVNDQSPTVGDEFSSKRVIDDPAKMFNVLTYRGRSLKELWAKINAKPPAERAVLIQRLEETFVVKTEGGLLVPSVPVFNYKAVLSPPENMEQYREATKYAQKKERPHQNQPAKPAAEAPAGGAAGGPDGDCPF